MDRRVGVVLAVVLLAGCGGFTAGNEATETVTPLDVPSPAETTQESRPGVAPGVSTTGVTDVQALAGAHRSAAQSTSYVFVENRSQTLYSDQSTLTTSESQRIVYVSQGEFYRYVPILDPDEFGVDRRRPEYERYGNGRVAYETWLSPLTGERQFDRAVNPHVGYRYALFPLNALLKYVPLESSVVARVDVAESNRRHYEVVGTRSSVGRYGPVRNFSARVVVREDGFVRSIDVAFDANASNQRVHVDYRAQYSDVGRATLSEPAWVPTAAANYQRGELREANRTLSDGEQVWIRKRGSVSRDARAGANPAFTATVPARKAAQ